MHDRGTAVTGTILCHTESPHCPSTRPFRKIVCCRTTSLFFPRLENGKISPLVALPYLDTIRDHPDLKAGTDRRRKTSRRPGNPCRTPAFVRPGSCSRKVGAPSTAESPKTPEKSCYSQLCTSARESTRNKMRPACPMGKPASTVSYKTNQIRSCKGCRIAFPTAREAGTSRIR